MDISSLINTPTLFAPTRLVDNVLNLKVGQQLDVNVIGADILAVKNAIALSLGDKNITVQSNQLFTPNPGLDLKLQVTQTTPAIEFKILNPLPESADLRLKLIPTAKDGGSVASGMEPMGPTARDGGGIQSTAGDDSNTPPPLPEKQPFDVKIISINGDKIQLQLLSSNKQDGLLTVDRAQLTNAPANLKAGQNLNLEIITSGATLKFKIIATANNIPEAKIAEFVKQFLPRHQASPIFLNQLMIDLPQLMKNNSVPQALKDIAVKIVQNLPPKEQLISSAGLKQAIVNSGVFLEAKLNSQAELIAALPQLIKNESVPLSLQRIAAKILQNMTQPATATLLNAKIVSIIGNKVQLHFLNTQLPSTAVLTIDKSQMTNAIANLKAGQNLNLEIITTGSQPEFKIVSAANNLPEVKAVEFVKQFLAQHQASPIILNQLIKDLPQMIRNNSVPQALKDIAVKIIQNLPPDEQLISSAGLKQAIVSSEVFLEAKLNSQPELISALPQLIKNESVPLSLLRVAAEIVQNLRSADLSLNNPKLADIAPTELSSMAKSGVLGGEDFKANLLNFVQALKQELSTHGTQQQVDLDLLKSLQNKTENTVAKIVLDQLMSLPKEDSPKQIWVIDIPYNHQQQAESVRIEVQRDKENKQEYNNNDWSVNITITPPGLGTIHCIVSYRNDVINTYFKSENGKTTELIKHNLDHLKNQLEASGLTTGHMDAHEGVQKTSAPHKLSGKKLFDDRA